ncbi:MAG: hypothetical protein JXP48_07005 [Acidobacteria bacterium]|nr:hypothetical protein [Acidobacteriota bacterium]
METDGIVGILRQTGPLTGWELLERSGMEALALWRACRGAGGIRMERAGTRYLRLDRSVEGYARLSPSIRREFLTYTVLGAEEGSGEVAERARRLRAEIAEISRGKFELAREAVASVTDALPLWEEIRERVCFIIAGDVTYGMAHAVPRPEISTGRMVRGSDLDIIVVARDDVPSAALAALDEAILRKKHYLLVHPNYQEEIDYLVKTLSRVREQLEFDSFSHMIASKILDEGEFLFGSDAVFGEVKGLVGEMGIPAKIAALDARAVESRREAEARLLGPDAAPDGRADLGLFYTSEEGDEIY